MSSYNQITIVGNCGGNPELRYSPNGVPICNLNVAVNDPKKVGEEWQDNTEWFRVICFKQIAERVNEKITKGQPVLVVGKLKLSRWEDKNSGEKRASLEIIANKVVGFGKSEKTGAPYVAASTVPSDVDIPNGDVDPDDIPFN
jgi:single-strand DNA-binding protein